MVQIFPIRMGKLELLLCHQIALLFTRVILETAENRMQLRLASQNMLAGTAGIKEGREAHLFDAMKILHEVWNHDMEQSTIARCWAKSGILPPTMHADIQAEHSSRGTTTRITQETKDAIDDITKALSKLSLPEISSSSSEDNLAHNIRGIIELHQHCSREEFEEELEQWTEIEESSDFVELLIKEREDCVLNDEALIASILNEVNISDEEEDEEAVPKGSILEIDVMTIYHQLIDLQTHLEQNGVADAADTIERARHQIMDASRKARRIASVPSRQLQIDLFLSKKETNK